MSNRRWSKFWWSDWQGDVALRRCSLAARGLWMEMLCLIHEADDRGRLTLNRQYIDGNLLFNLLSIDARTGRHALAELERYSVFSRDEDGVIYSRRVRKDQGLSEKGSESAGKRWGSEPNGSPNGKANSEPNGEPNARSRSRSRSRSSTPLTPQGGGEFDSFWSAYPRKVGKGQARRAWEGAIRKAAPTTIIDALKHQITASVFDRSEKFQPHPSTWLNGERWLDQVEHPDAAILRAVGIDPDGEIDLLTIPAIGGTQ